MENLHPPATETPERIHETLADLTIPVETVQPYARNPRRGDLDTIAASLATNGQYRPIVINAGSLTGRKNEILAGNHTYTAAVERLHWRRIAATFVDVDDETAVRIVAVDNRANDLAGYDNEALAALLAELPTLDGTGYTTDDLAALLDAAEPPDLSGFKDFDDIGDDAGDAKTATCPSCGHSFTP